MVAAGSWWFPFVVVLVVGAPWVAAIAYYWPKVRRDGYVPPSLGEVVRERLWGPEP